MRKVPFDCLRKSARVRSEPPDGSRHCLMEGGSVPTMDQDLDIPRGFEVDRINAQVEDLGALDTS